MTDKPKPFECSICFRICEGYGNNPEPINAGRCCDRCNDLIVIPARVRLMQRMENGEDAR